MFVIIRSISSELFLATRSLFPIFILGNCIVLTHADPSKLSSNENQVRSAYKNASLQVMYVPAKGDSLYHLEEEEQADRQGEWKDLFLSVCEDSELFQSVSFEERADIQIRVKVVEQEAENRSIGYLLSKGYGFRPYREEGSFLVSTDFYDSEGNHLGSVDLSEKYEYYYQIFFLFLMPFYLPSWEYDSLARYMAVKTLQTAQAQGIFKKPVPSSLKKDKN
ncbi:hypothetical protein EHQ53_11010 [Leptospira langatensis]|uniref:Uncharacterized protein n=1 Tax=Leptospira langatensis TaxID=2484983 RepID=A0A5F1ZSD2_9LEPT|nr:hypothetical protein [Leptospira langatensis]TGJ98919.1 hypothetical protein EHO57_15490 [Leptospira langatensis]TGL40514.1 hypothetical protein EHQ53_11010 [Leptospira langatensis]